MTERPAWFPDWRGQVAALVASGPSVTRENVEKLRGRCRVMAVNNNYQLAPWADALYAGDGPWWERHKGVPGFAGLKITQDQGAAQRWQLHRVHLVEPRDKHAHRIITDPPGTIGWGENGGFQAANVIVQFGPPRLLLLVGVDCTGLRWHGRHYPDGKLGQKPKSLAYWAKLFDAQADRFKALGIEVVNCSPISALTRYPRMTVDEALACEYA